MVVNRLELERILSEKDKEVLGHVELQIDKVLKERWEGLYLNFNIEEDKIKAQIKKQLEEKYQKEGFKLEFTESNNPIHHETSTSVTVTPCEPEFRIEGMTQISQGTYVVNKSTSIYDFDPKTEDSDDYK